MLDSVREGVVAAARAWPLTLLQFGAKVLYVLAFLIMVLVPVLVFFVALGLDVGGMENLPENPAEVISLFGGHLVGVLVSLLAFLAWLCLVMAAALFVYGGTLGALYRGVEAPASAGDVGAFFSSGKRHFWPFVWLVTYVSVIGLLPLFVGGAGVLVAVLLDAFSGSGAMGVFLGYFSVVGSVVFALLLFLGIMAYWSFASAALVSRDLGAREAIREGWRFMRDNPASLPFYLLVVFLYLCTVLGLMIIVGAIQIIPMVGILVALPFQLVNAVVTTFLGIAMNGAFLAYYLKKTGRWPRKADADPVPKVLPDQAYSAGENI